MSSEGVTVNLPDSPSNRDGEGYVSNESPKLRRKFSRGPSLDNDAFSPKASSPDKPFTPKGSLFKMTQSRMKEVEATEAKIKVMNEQKEEEVLKRALSFTEKKPELTKKNSVGPSERLMKTTQARIIDTRELELRKDRIDASQDIWWDIRKKAETAAPRAGVQSKLYEPTVAYLASNRNKHPLKKANSGIPESPEKEQLAVQKINEESSLLKPTRSSVIGMYGKDLSVLEDIPTFQPSLATGSNENVKSKLLEPTRANDASKYKSKEQLAEEEAAEIAAAKADAPKVKQTSERLISLNSNLKNAARTKVTKDEVDPREEGWNNETGHTSIPEPAPVSYPPNRRYSNSPAKVISRRNSSSSVLNASPMPKNGHGSSTEAVAPTEAPEDGMEVSSGAPETNEEM